jgi:chromate transporter
MSATKVSADAPDLKELTRVFARIGMLSFGGPAAQISLMHKELVEDRPWLSERQYLSGLSFCMMLPGPEAMQLATYSGWRLHGVRGGLIAGSLFVLPGALVILALATIYAYFGNLPLVQTLFLGVQAAVVAIVVQALLRLSRKTLSTRMSWILATLSFVGIAFLNLPFPLIIGAAAAIGALMATGSTTPPGESRPANTGRVLLIGGLAWSAPVVLLWATGQSLLFQIAVFFSKLAVVTFGGAYAVLGYMTQEVVAEKHWLTTGQMIDALGLAETTPGPLILVTEFVGFLAGFTEGGLMLAIAAALVTLWVTFVPCFLWIFLGAPYLDWIASRPRLTGALTALTSAVVGVILNLALWFAIHVFFDRVTMRSVGPFQWAQPDWTSLDPIAVTLALVAAFLLFGVRFGMPLVLCVTALLGVGLAELF